MITIVSYLEWIPIGYESHTLNEIPAPAPVKKRRFIGWAGIDPVNTKTNFSDIVDELIRHFTV